MHDTEYSSKRNNNFEKQNSKNRKISQLARDSFAAFQPFINIFDPGVKAEGRPIHTITKQDWELYRRYKSGEKNVRYPDGTQFHPFRDVIGNIYSERHVEKHIEDGQISYYTSGRNKQGLLYLDIDAHYDWQTDEYRAKQILAKVFPFAYFRTSNRGQNGYLKVRYNSIAEFNELAKQVQNKIQHLFLHLGVLCDFEVKGTITDNGKSGLLAKLPFQNKFLATCGTRPTVGIIVS